MAKPVEIENIEEMRRRVGIDDVELRQAIRGLRIGDYVKLTLRTGATSSAGEVFLVRITRIRGPEFRGKLADRLASPARSGLRAGSSLKPSWRLAAPPPSSACFTSPFLSICSPACSELLLSSPTFFFTRL